MDDSHPLQKRHLAVQNACNTLNTRLNQVRQTMSNPTWQELVNQCYNLGVDLSAKVSTVSALESTISHSNYFFRGGFHPHHRPAGLSTSRTAWWPTRLRSTCSLARSRSSKQIFCSTAVKGLFCVSRLLTSTHICIQLESAN